ncbi:hypothetical protein [Flindersiella endophytica]
METHSEGDPTAKKAAAEALAAAEDSRQRTRRADYPAWFWWSTGVAVAAIAVELLVPMPSWATTLLGFAVVAGCGVTAWSTARVRRLRGARTTSTMVWWLVVPAVALLVVAGVLQVIGWWADPIGGLLTAAVVGAVWVATGLKISRRPGALR